MIEITIPYWFGAALGCLSMITTIIALFTAIVVGRTDHAVVLIIVLLGSDAILALMSAEYMSTPTNGTDFNGDGTCYNRDGIHPCTYPTINPYEQQPLHPILWIWGSIGFGFSSITNAIHIKREVV